MTTDTAISLDLLGRAQGRFKIDKFKTDAEGNEIQGTREEIVPWFDNLILNLGLDLIGTSLNGMNNTLQACRVGSGSTTPAVTDTALVAQVAGTTTVATNVSGAQPTAPYFGWFRKTYRFTTGVATGNLSEVGVATTTTGGVLFSRALIVDGVGTPTTITVQADESLDVTYELRLYPPTTDIPWSATISGTAYSGVVRAERVATSTAWNSGGPGWTMDPTSNSLKGGILATSNGMQVYNGTIGAITATPSGTALTVDLSGASSVTPGTYTAGSYQRSSVIQVELTQGNVAGGISAFRIVTGIGSYQFSVSPALAKDATKRLNLNVTLSWGRYTP